ncbi:unnamed protein product [Meganyctiphanes norvegica]|uniref:Uncharacterized protein n=1 Tax=Meganyctiphanes norvegica TaxID=48144 RepID=A0AAV2QIE7_MEGNR
MADIECEICFKSFNDKDRKPRNLPCGHVCCSSCLGESISRGSHNCSTCRSPHHASAASDLPVNFYIMKLVDQPPITEKPKESADDFNGGNCPEHKSSYLYFVCRTHNIQICRECTVIEHSPSTCDVISFKAQIEQRRSDLLKELNVEISLVAESIGHLNEYETSKSNDVKYKSNEIERLLQEIDEDRKASDKAKKAKEESTKENATKKIEITESCSAVREKVRSSQIWIEDTMKHFDFNLSEQLYIKNPKSFMRTFLNNKREEVYVVQQTGSVYRSEKLRVKDGVIVLNALHKNIQPTGHAVTIQVSNFLDFDITPDSKFLASTDDYDIDCEEVNYNLYHNQRSRIERPIDLGLYNLLYNGGVIDKSERDTEAASPRSSGTNISRVFISFVSGTNICDSKQELGTVYIDIDQDAPQAKQFLSLFTGTQGYSYKGLANIQVMRDNSNSSPHAISTNNIVQEKGTNRSIRLFSQNSNNSKINEKNNVCLYGNCGFVIFHEQPPTTSYYEVVGSVVSGLEIISKVADMLGRKTSNAQRPNPIMNQHPNAMFHPLHRHTINKHRNQVNITIDEVGVVIQ